MVIPSKDTLFIYISILLYFKLNQPFGILYLQLHYLQYISFILEQQFIHCLGLDEEIFENLDSELCTRSLVLGMGFIAMDGAMFFG